MPRHTTRGAGAHNLLPNFCAAPHLLYIAIVSEAVAVILTLANGRDVGAMLPRLLLLTLYLQWIGLCGAAVLCLIGRRLATRLSMLGMLAVSYGALLAVTFIIAEATHALARYTWLGFLLGDLQHADFVLRSVAVCAVVAALALHYFWLRASWRAGLQAEAAVRLDALQARIRPHFLFNSLNSIASLIGLRPDDAEKAIEDLALLLRARLRADAPDMVPLADELALVKAYLRIEQHRLGERLALDWRVVPGIGDHLVPALSLQPLVENAINHGIAARRDGGTLALRAQLNGKQLWIRIINPLADDHDASAVRAQAGNRQALSNIEQRLNLRYGRHARLLTMRKDARFYLDLVMPVQK
ncbi:MAG TPA: histidine kinase [Salinisphaeraceae bacterium]|nr:histidine kinase [Salinisphaeraceae bacterium]